MAENIERRKYAFKTKQLNSTERTRKQSEQLRKEKRTANVLAKRLKTDSTEPVNEEFDEVQVKDALHNAMSGDPTDRLPALRTLRAILCSSSPRFDLFVESNVSVYLSNLLNSPNDDIRLEAAWCLTNMATGGNAETGAVLCAVPNMVEILNSNSLESNVGRDTVEFQEQICWALGNIAGDSEEHRSVLIGNGALLAVLNFLEARVHALFAAGVKRDSPTSLPALASAAQTAAWALSNLARGKVPASLFIDTGKVPFLISLVNLHSRWLAEHGASENSDPLVAQGARAVAEEAWWLFAFLTAKEDAAVTVLLNHSLVESLGDAVSAVGEDTVAVIPLIRCLGNLSSGPGEWLAALMTDARAVDALLRCSRPAAHRVVIKECLWVVSNVLGGSEASRNFLIHYGSSDASPSPLLEHLLRALQRDDFDVQQEATLALEQACLSPACRGMLLAVPQYAAEIAALGMVFERLLRAPGTSDAPISVMRVISALTAAAGELGPGRQLELANVWVDVGITEALDDIQGRDGCSVGDVAAALVTQLYALLEDAEREHDDRRGAEIGHSNSSNGHGYDSGHGNEVAGQFASGYGGEPAVVAGQYAFTAPIGSVFAFGPGAGPDTPQRGVNLGDNGSPTPHTSPVAAQGRGGMGRGSHLAKPSWMT